MPNKTEIIFFSGSLYRIIFYNFFRGAGEFPHQGIDSLSFTYAIDNFKVKRDTLDSIQKLLVGMIMRLVRNAAYEWKRECLRKIFQMGEIEYKRRVVMEI